ncbi:MAG: carbon-nitrogen hydrolase family protein [Methyloligellaceae bacterium]
MRIATAQIQIENCPKSNAAQMKKFIHGAAQDDADVIHFPESSLSGYVKAQITDWSDVDWNALEDELHNIQDLCAAQNIGAVIGSAHNHTGMDRPFNCLYVIDSNGNMVARYDKRFCSHSEITDWYSAGKIPVVVDIQGFKLGFALCIEIQFPEIFMEYERMGVDCVLLSAYSDSEMFAVQAQGHAACNNYWISYSVPANISDKQSSCFIGPDGSVVGVCEQGKAGYIVNKIDPNDPQWAIPCTKARPWRRLAREGNIYDDFQEK